MNYLLATVALVTALVFGLVWLNESTATRIKAEAQAESMIIRAQAESRLTSAQASAITMAAITPMVLIITIGFVGSIFAVGLVIYAVKRRPQAIERQIILIPANLPRREVWQMLSQQSEMMVLPGKFEVKQ